MTMVKIVLGTIGIIACTWMYGETPPPYIVSEDSDLAEVLEGTFRGLDQVGGAYQVIVDVELQDPLPPVARARCLIGAPTQGFGLIVPGRASDAYDDSYFTVVNMTKSPAFLDFVKQNWLDHPRFDESRSRLGSRVVVAPGVKYCHEFHFIDD